MDRQLACATFATLIPLLLIGAVLSDAWPQKLAAPVKVIYTILLLGVSTSETIAIVGTADPHVGPMAVFWSAVGAIVSSWVAFGALLIRILDVQPWSFRQRKQANAASNRNHTPSPTRDVAVPDTPTDPLAATPREHVVGEAADVRGPVQHRFVHLPRLRFKAWRRHGDGDDGPASTV